MEIGKLEQRLIAAGQEHLLEHLAQLDKAGAERLRAQLAALDWSQIERLRQQLAARHEVAAASGELQPAAVITPGAAEVAAATLCGNEALQRGEVGVLLVAGGQGSRLGFDGPKGAYPIGPVSNAVLFHFHARKVLALQRRFGAAIPFYIMTSEGNDQATRDTFADHNWFGLAPGDVFFFKQGMWPAFDGEGRLILDAPGRLFMSPDGHGGTLSAFKASGGLADATRRGLKTLFYFQVDNPLVEVADPAFIGLHLKAAADISVKVCAKRDPYEGLGVVVEREGRCEIVEYIEFTNEQKERRGSDGELYYRYGSVAIHLFQLDFLRRMAEVELPLHLAHKKIPVSLPTGEVVVPTEPNGYKFEKFIFDLLPLAARVINVAFERSEEFSPVKNATGADSPASCRRDLMLKWAGWLEAAGVAIPRDAQGVPRHAIEIDPAYARTSAELCQRLQEGEVVIETGEPIYLYEA